MELRRELLCEPGGKGVGTRERCKGVSSNDDVPTPSAAVAEEELLLLRRVEANGVLPESGSWTPLPPPVREAALSRVVVGLLLLAVLLVRAASCMMCKATHSCAG
jgi:hypothetical protein